MITCPHCFTVVLPSADGECPACGRNTRQGGDRSRQVFAVKASDRLPSLCCLCCAPATRWVTVSRERRTGGEHPVVASLVRAFSPLLYLAHRDEIAGRHEGLHVDLPLCDAHEPPEPAHVGFEREQISFVLAIEFANLVTASR